MVLGKVRIQNFKSIIDTGWVYLNKGDLINILAGQNESGKTSFLRGLRFFEEGSYSTFEEEDRRMGTFPRVECTYYLTDTEYEKLKTDTNIKIADYVKRNGFTFIRGEVDMDDFDEQYDFSEEFESLVDEYNAERKVVFEKEEEQKEEGAAKGEFQDFDTFNYFSAIRPEMVFYSSFSEYNLPGKVTRAEISSKQAVLDFQTVYNIDFDALLDPNAPNKKQRSEEERVRREAANSLNQYWNQVISGEEPEYRYVISINTQNSDPAASSVNFYINQGDEHQLSISQKSQGFQWFSGFNLKLRAHQADLEERGLILLIDEPGQGLHEVAQQDVKNVIEELAKESRIQIIYTTHQPILLGKDQIDFSRVILVDRTVEDGSVFKTVSALVSSNGSLDALAPIRSALGMVTLTDPFSDKKTLIVEGITEYYLTKAVFNTQFIIVPSAGVDQVPNIFAILYAWGVPAKVLVDDDAQGTKAFNKLKKSFFNNLDSEDFKNTVMKPNACDGIENLVSKEDIVLVMADYGKVYQDNLSKVENVETVGKFIFAKSFYDKFVNNPALLSGETKANFQKVQDFVNK